MEKDKEATIGMEVTDMASLSIIVPVYNTTCYLRQCVDSLLFQDYRDIEIILVDDGSTDGSGEICDAYAALDSRVKVLHQTNQGQSSARQAGMAIAQGWAVTFVDSDDWVEANAFSKFMERLNQEWDTDICIGTMIRDYPDGNTECLVHQGPAHHLHRAEALEEMFSGSLFRWELPSKIYRKNLFEGIKSTKGVAVLEDFYWNWQIFRNVRQVYFAPSKTYHYRFNPESVTNQGRLVWAEKELSIWEDFLSTSGVELGPQGRKLLKNRLPSCLAYYFANQLCQHKSWQAAMGATSRRKHELVEHANLINPTEVQQELDRTLEDIMDIKNQLSSMYAGGAKIYLYGAGLLATLAAAIAINEDMVISGCIISDGQKKIRETICGLPVLFLSEVNQKMHLTIIVTSAVRYDVQILPILQKRDWSVKALTGWRDRL